MKFHYAALALTVFALGACSIKQDVVPIQVAPNAAREVCIVEDTAVRATFLTTYQQTLEARGYVARVLPPRSSITSCPITSTYTARWSWDFTIYMSFADIRVYSDGREAGRATYDSRAGGMRLDKWVNAEGKIQDMVAELFPQL